ncbi:hypothetical protein [Ferviditalea candida]|uniref:Uncharacterized protein n=1 Tax=Ferviditalea candida TaxID=3108399 RepID=A0ABU5ZM49_9BACL|nr:hypothetical protein [Paenibacillaceae bacterium T2]
MSASVFEMHADPDSDPTRKKFRAIMDPYYSLKREDIVWMLEYIKKKVADADPHLLNLTKPRLLSNQYYFAKVALMLIQKQYGGQQEMAQIKHWLAEAAYGLEPDA